MSTELVNWVEKLASEAKDVAALERPSLSQISTRSGVMTYQKQQVPGNKLLCIVLSSVFENKYYEGSFNPNEYQSPVCYALSASGEEMMPHPDSKDIQNDHCDGCEKNKWGSATRDGRPSKGKACKDTRRLALIPASVLDGGNIATAETAVLALPVTSVRNWAVYVNGLAAEYSRPPWAMLTEVRLEPDTKTQFQVRFECKGLVQEEFLAALYRRVQPATEVLLTPYDETGTVARAPDPMPKEGKKY